MMTIQKQWQAVALQQYTQPWSYKQGEFNCLSVEGKFDPKSEKPACCQENRNVGNLEL